MRVGVTAQTDKSGGEEAKSELGPEVFRAQSGKVKGKGRWPREEGGGGCSGTHSRQKVLPEELCGKQQSEQKETASDPPEEQVVRVSEVPST